MVFHSPFPPFCLSGIYSYKSAVFPYKACFLCALMSNTRWKEVLSVSRGIPPTPGLHLGLGRGAHEFPPTHTPKPEGLQRDQVRSQSWAGPSRSISRRSGRSPGMGPRRPTPRGQLVVCASGGWARRPVRGCGAATHTFHAVL